MAFELDLEGRGEGNSGKGRGRYRGLELGVWAASKAGLLPRSLKSRTNAKDKVLEHTQQQGMGFGRGRAFCWREEARHTSETQVSREGQSPLPRPPRVTHGARDAIWPAAVSCTLAICGLRRLPSVREISRLHSQL